MSLYQMVLKKLKMATFKNSLQALREERGAIFVLTAILLPVILGFMGFGYDVGNLYMHKARLQNAADAASLAGARAFVDEASSQRKTLRTQYMNNNNVTSIPTDVSAEINETVKTEAKTAAKTAAVANVVKNMVNLHNNDYQSKYYLVTGRITESGKNYEQQYFKANLEETVPLYFIPILLDLKEQKVAAEAISTIINKGTGKASNKKEKFGPDSLFMTKHGFANLGDTFYNDGAGNTDTKAPTWTDDYFEGNLRYTEDDFIADFGNNTKLNNYAGGVPFEGVFNKKATELMTKLKKLMNGYNEADYNAFIDELKTHPDFYSVENNAFTEKGNVLFQKTQELLPNSGVQGDFWGVYNAFYDELVSNKNYFRTFQKLENYNIDKFGDSVKALFKRKLAAEQGISEETYRAQWQEAHDAWVTTTSDGGEWKTAHDTWQTNHNAWQAAENTAKAAAQAQIDEMVANGGGGSSVIDPYNCTPQQAYEILKKYKDMYPAKAAMINGRSGNDYAWDEYCNAGDNLYFNLSKDNFINYVQNIVYNASYSQWEDVPTDWSDWLYMGLRQSYEAYKANGGTANLTPKDAYDKLVVYKDFINKDADTLCTLLVMDEYKQDGSPYGIIYDWDFVNKVKNMPTLNNDSLTWSMIDYNNSDFQQLQIDNNTKDWVVNLKTLYVQGNGNLNPSSSGIPTVEQLMAQWYADPANAEPVEPPMPDEPQIENYINSTNGDEYYAQYHGSENKWTASAISSQQNSKEHSYFYYPAPNNFDLTIDAAGFYTDDTVTVEDPFYLFIGDNFQGDIINIILDADVNRPLIFCYMGTKNIKIHIKLQGHTFQGIIYTPHAHGSEVFMNANSGSTRGTFKGTWMSDTVTLKQNSSHYEYAEFYLDSSLKSAMPNFTGETQEGDDEYGDDEDLSDKNPIKVIKLVKSVADILSVEEIN